MTVEELLNKHNIKFRYSGRDLLVCCLNPEHDDSNPSMRIDRVLGIFNCLSCGYKGNIFHLFGEKINKSDTVRELVRRRIADIRLQSSGVIIPDNIMYVDYDYRVSAKTLVEFEAFKCADKEYADRIIFPIRDIKGKVSCLIGRSEDAFEKARKYKVFPQNAKVPLFPLNKFKPINGRAVLVEGLFDMLNLYDNGLTNTLCAFGVNTVTEEKLNLLKILGVTGIDIIFDSDDAGQAGAEKLKDLAESINLDIRNIKLKRGDPGDLSHDSVVKLRNKLYE